MWFAFLIVKNSFTAVPYIEKNVTIIVRLWIKLWYHQCIATRRHFSRCNIESRTLHFHFSKQCQKQIKSHPISQKGYFLRSHSNRFSCKRKKSLEMFENQWIQEDWVKISIKLKLIIACITAALSDFSFREGGCDTEITQILQVLIKYP